MSVFARTRYFGLVGFMNAVTYKERFDIGVLAAETTVKVGRILSAAARKQPQKFLL